MSSPDPVLVWSPPDLDTASGGTLTARLPAHASASRIGMPSAPTTGWAPPALEEWRPKPALPKQSDVERAYEQGYAEGRESGRNEGQGDVAPALKALDGLLVHLQSAEADFARERERNLVALALVVARKLAMQEIEARPEVLQALVNKALEMIPAAVPSEIRMHPDDLAALVPAIETMAMEGRAPAAQWVGDPSLTRGSFMVESPVRVIDGRIDIALRLLYERLERD